MVTIALTVTIGILLLYTGYQMRVIDRLTNKIMARDYVEYRQLEAPVTPLDLTKHKPMSWADEVHTDED